MIEVQAPATPGAASADNLENLVVVLSPSGVVESVNDVCRRVTGHTFDDLLGKPLWESLLPEDQALPVQRAFDRLRQGEAKARIVSLLRTRAGPPRRIAWTFTIVQRDDGRLQSIIGNGVDALASAMDKDSRKSEEIAKKSLDALESIEGYLREGQLPPLTLLQELIELQTDSAASRAGDGVQDGASKPFPYVQRLAPWEGGRLPPHRAFFEVRCQDISATGFSFLLNHRPSFERLVVGFGPGVSRIYIVAEVREVVRLEASGRSDYRVDCEFLARVYY